jgi:hypothetical protein
METLYESMECRFLLCGFVNNAIAYKIYYFMDNKEIQEPGITNYIEMNHDSSNKVTLPLQRSIPFRTTSPVKMGETDFCATIKKTKSQDLLDGLIQFKLDIISPTQKLHTLARSRRNMRDLVIHTLMVQK